MTKNALKILSGVSVVEGPGDTWVITDAFGYKVLLTAKQIKWVADSVDEQRSGK